MQKDYSHYTAEDLLQDDLFLQYLWHPSPENTCFWANEMRRSPSLAAEIQKASFFIQCLQVKKEKLSTAEVTEMWKHIRRAGKKNQHHLYRKLSVAAGFLLLIGISLFWITRPASQRGETEIAFVDRPQINGNDVQLVLVDNQTKRIGGKDVALHYANDGTVKIDADTVDIIESQPATQQHNQPVYNQLIVPFGKRSSLSLSDGTKIWVNAGSRVVFPIEFAQDKREIYVEGEVFLEVARNENKPFFVRTKEFDVDVLGTSFDIIAYPGDKNQAVVLVAGKVNVTTKEGRQTKLTPNDKFEWEDGKTVVKVVDPCNYIAWKDGLYRFESVPFGKVLDRLARYYGRVIKYDDEIAGMSCSGKLDLKDELSEVLEGWLVKTLPMRYHISGDTVYLNAQRQIEF